MVQITGTPAATGAYTFTLQATDTASNTASVTLTITITAVPVVPVSVPASWRFLLAAPQPDGTYLAEIAQAQNRTLTMRTEPDQASETTFDILGDTGPGAQVTELETDIHVMYGTQLLYAGRVGATQDSITAAGYYLNVTSADYREVLRRRAILPGDTLSFTGTEQALIAWNLLNASQGRSGGALGIARGTGQNTGINRTMTFTNGDYIGDRITQMAQLTNGFEWQINPYNQADLRLDVFYPQQGTNRGVVLAPGDGRVTSITRATDPSAFANAIYETASGLTAQFVESGTIIAEGRWDKVIGSDLKTSSALTDDATAQLTAAQVLVPAYTIVLRPGSWGGPADIWLGDTITVQIRAGRLDVSDQLRVAEMQFAISADGQETLTLTVGMLPLNLFKKIPAMLKRLVYLEKR